MILLKILDFFCLLSLIILPAVRLQGTTRSYGDASLHAEDGQTLSSIKLSSKQRKHLETKILNIFGLESPPDQDSDYTKEIPGVSNYMLQLYKQLVNHKSSSKLFSPNSKSRSGDKEIGDEFWTRFSSADTVMSFLDHATFEHSTASLNSTVFLNFNLDELKLTELQGAILKIFIDTRSIQQSHVRLQVFQESHEESADIVVQKEIPQNTRGWLEIDVSKVLRGWMKYPSKNRGFILSVEDEHGNLLEPSCVELAGRTKKLNKKKQAFLVAIFRSPRQDVIVLSRKKRSNTSRPQQSKSPHYEFNPAFDSPKNYGYGRMTRCQRRTLYVDFKDFGWKRWIIAPEGYYAHFCHGECTFPLHAHMNATNHAIIQTLVHLIHPLNVPKPCCAPTKLSSLPVLYFDNVVILKKYRNMVVKACGCH